MCISIIYTYTTLINYPQDLPNITLIFPHWISIGKRRKQIEKGEERGLATHLGMLDQQVEDRTVVVPLRASARRDDVMDFGVYHGFRGETMEEFITWWSLFLSRSCNTY